MFAAPAPPLPPRAQAELRLTLARAGTRTEPFRAYETGGYRWRFPRSAALAQAVIVNTGGGMAGGDTLRLEVRAEPGARACVTSQSMEKIYRADGRTCSVENRFEVAAGAWLIYAPQETLLFDGAALDRRLSAEVEDGGALTLIESLAFGRLAHGESHARATFTDRWRLRHSGPLVFAEAFRIENAGQTLDRPALGAGARALATIVHIGAGAGDRLEPLRETLTAMEVAPGARLDAAASVVDGVLVARLASPSPQRLRAALIAIFPALTGAEAPRVWR